MTLSRLPYCWYKYDYLGRRVKKQVLVSTTTKYCYDGDQVIAEYDSNDTLLRKFIYGPGIDEPILMIDVPDNNAVYYYHFDGLGSVAALSNSGGNMAERYEYDVFGQPTIKSPGDEIRDTSDVNNSYMFTARRYDEETSLYYYRARYYDPYIGRFLQVDPVGYEDSLNLYTYVANNPVNRVDPRGLGFGDVWDCIKDALKYSEVHTTIDVIGVIALYAACVAGCGAVTGGCGVAPCLYGCLAAVVGGHAAGLILGCLL